MAAFNPFRQKVSFFAADGTTKISVPVPVIDQANFEAFGVCINYGTQIGACLVMLIILLVTTPASKLRRASNVLQILALVICPVELIVLVLYFPSPLNEFYRYWAEDYSGVPQRYFDMSIAGSTLSILLVAVLELELMNQAWIMVKLWPNPVKYAVSFVSVLVSLNTLGWRMAFVVLQNESVVNLSRPHNIEMVSEVTVATNAASIFFFCAVFNIKLVQHLITNRSILPSSKALNSMEILVMTNGILMIFPVVFAGLEWGSFTNFEAGSWTLTSVAIILPMGAMAAQRVGRGDNNTGPCSNCATLRRLLVPDTSSSSNVYKPWSISTSSRTGMTPQTSVLSRCEAGGGHKEHLDPIDLELLYIDGHVRVDRNVELHVDHV